MAGLRVDARAVVSKNYLHCSWMGIEGSLKDVSSSCFRVSVDARAVAALRMLDGFL